MEANVRATVSSWRVLKSNMLHFLGDAVAVQRLAVAVEREPTRLRARATKRKFCCQTMPALLRKYKHHVSRLQNF
jgi:hypothetical protein